jgi:Yip1 domain
VSQSQPAVPEPVPPPPSLPEEPSPGLFDVLLNLFVEPRTAFAAILKSPGRFWSPMIGSIVLNLVFTAIWMQKVDPEQFMRNQIEESGRADQIPPERMEQVIEQQSKVMKITAPISATLAPPLLIAAFGGLFLFVYRFFYGGEVGFKQSLSIVAWSSFAVALVTVPIMLAIYAGKGDWNLNPQTVVQANLSLLLDKETTSRALYSVAESIDLFSAWMIFLLATGYGLAVRRPVSAALWGILIPWALYVLVKMGFVALMS